MFNNMKLSTKLLTIGILLTAVPLLIIFVTVLRQNSRMAQVAAEESSKIASDDLNHLVKGIYKTCEARHGAVLAHTQAGLNVARDVLAKTGEISFEENTVSWDAVNQYTKVSSKISLPKMIVGGIWLGQNADKDKNSPVVDSIKEIAGGTCTIFQRMNEAGDMLRVSTNVIKKDGTRAIGTFIPAINPDGRQNPVISTVLKGRIYTGRAYVVDGWYITAYEPIYDINKRIIGILYVGFPQDAGDRIRESIINTSIGETGYVYVLDSKGKYIISKDGKRDGEDIWETKDADGNYFIQEMCRKAVGSQQGDIVEQRYAWKNAGDKMAYFKIARIMYFKPWDWVIGAGAYEREVFAAKEKVTELGERITAVLSLVFGLSLLAAILIWYFVASGIAGKISMVLNHLTIASDQTNDASGQISSTSQALAEGASEQASSLEETSASIEEMASMTKHNADNANQADSLMKEAGQVVRRANQSMSELTTSMKDMSKASEETSKIVKTIDEIAFQTNLLALNAAVEAARAGEQGAGFAVVADEVRNLAMRSAEAAKNTSELIEGTVRSIGGGSEIVVRTNEAFTEMMSNISKVEELVSEIAAGSHEHSQAIDQISRAIIEIDKVTQQNAANAEESASSTEELNAQAEEMKSLVYKLSELVGNDSKINSKVDKTNRKTKYAGKRLSDEFHKAISAPQEKTGAKKISAISRSERKVGPDEIIPMHEEDLIDF